MSHSDMFAEPTQPLYNTVHYNMVLDVGFGYNMDQCLTPRLALISAWIGQLTRKLAQTPTIVLYRGCGGSDVLPKCSLSHG